MTNEVMTTLDVQELRTNKFGMAGQASQGQTSDAKQAEPASYATGAFGLDSDVKMEALYDLILQMRAALVANGMMKGGA